MDKMMIAFAMIAVMALVVAMVSLGVAFAVISEYHPSTSTPTLTSKIAPAPTIGPTSTPLPATAPEITSVSPIYAVQSQTITIQGNGFGNIQPQLMSLGDGSVDTVWGGSAPSIVILDERNELSAGAAGAWSGFTNGPPDLIGVVFVSWTNTQIVLGGFGSGLGSQFSWGQVLQGDILQIQIQTVGGVATYDTAVA
jgi:hypothetical protein